MVAMAAQAAEAETAAKALEMAAQAVRVETEVVQETEVTVVAAERLSSTQEKFR